MAANVVSMHLDSPAQAVVIVEGPTRDSVADVDAKKAALMAATEKMPRPGINKGSGPYGVDAEGNLSGGEVPVRWRQDFTVLSAYA